mmetsp:Transcript_10859/g.25007  ORF Transcript_10859/g.25007 Transcript_10859/m.25007 type:complete len:83 (+) Transcript_10859:663-911(+)
MCPCLRYSFVTQMAENFPQHALALPVTPTSSSTGTSSRATQFLLPCQLISQRGDTGAAPLTHRQCWQWQRAQCAAAHEAMML